MAAVSELRDEYGDQVELTVISAEQTAERKDEILRYNLASRGHGLVGFDAAGEPVASIAGHRFGEDEIRVVIAQATLE